MRKLFSKPHERQKGSFDASEIEIIGVGCGGTNIVNYMQTHGFKDFPLAVCDMDASVIEHSKVREKLLFGMDGLGAGNNPELGKSEAEKKMIDIRSIIKEHTKVSFVVVCLGGGCGTGASPVVAREIKKRGVKTIGVATLPFEFEGRLKFNQAMDGLIELATYTDAIFVLNNQYTQSPSRIGYECSIHNGRRIDGKGRVEYYRLHVREPQFEAYKWNNRLYQKVIHSF